MRISTLQIYDRGVKGMTDATENAERTQSQIGKGAEVLKPADDPSAANRIQSLTQHLAVTEQHERNIDLAENNLTLQEATLGGVITILQRINEMALQAINGTLGPDDYTTLATEVDTRLEEMLGLLNRKNANGDYIFAGFQGRKEPFVTDEAGGIRYQGDEGRKFLEISETLKIPVTDSDKKLFQDVDSAQNTVNTFRDSDNRSDPPASISVGIVVDQATYDAFYPQDMEIVFNDDREVEPPRQNFSVLSRATGEVLLDKQFYQPGQDFIVEGVSVHLEGFPASGVQATPATLAFGDFPVMPLPPAPTPTAPFQDFSADETGTVFTLEVGGLQETFVLDMDVTSNADLVLVLTDENNGNLQRLERLGLTVDETGFSMAEGLNIAMVSGNSVALTALGLDGTAESVDGVAAVKGDRFIIQSSNKQSTLATLSRFSAAMKRADNSPETQQQLDQIAGDTIANVQNAQESILLVLTEVGARLNTLDNTRDLHAEATVINKALLSEFKDLDYAEAVSQLSLETLILEASQQSFAQISRLTLFDNL
jgi:flagellar hook-associated protein 3 FlgL